MKTAQKQVLIIQACDLLKAALSLVNTAYMDEAGAGAMVEAAAKLEAASFDLRLVSAAVRSDVREARDALREPGVIRLIREFDKLPHEHRAEIFQDVSRRIERLERGMSVVQHEQPVLAKPSAPNLALPVPVKSASSQVMISRNRDVSSVPVRRPKKVSRERGLRLFQELEAEIRAKRPPE